MTDRPTRDGLLDVRLVFELLGPHGHVALRHTDQQILNLNLGSECGRSKLSHLSEHSWRGCSSREAAVTRSGQRNVDRQYAVLIDVNVLDAHGCGYKGSTRRIHEAAAPLAFLVTGKATLALAHEL